MSSSEVRETASDKRLSGAGLPCLTHDEWMEECSVLLSVSIFSVVRIYGQIPQFVD